MTRQEALPLLYSDLSDWWPLLSSPADYEEEAAFYRQVLLDTSERNIQTVVEFGSGGGNNASHLKAQFDMTLVDVSPGMIAVSRQLNPECDHLIGDMRQVRLGGEFDAVFIHDAINYIVSREDLRATMETAFLHCRPGGAALFAPDFTRENFAPFTTHGGHDAAGRSLRYLQWTWDPEPGDGKYSSLMVYVLRERSEEPRVVVDRHTCGLFSEQEWLETAEAAGFSAKAIPFDHSEIEHEGLKMIVGLKPTGSNP